MRRALLLAAALLAPLSASAQPGSACEVSDHLPPALLSGPWEVTLWPESPRATRPVSEGTLLLEPHPDYVGSVRGNLARSGLGPEVQAVVSGDVTEGHFHLDESEDGQRMSAVWDGTAQDCHGRIFITGQRRLTDGSDSTAGAAVLRFRIQRKPSW